MKSLMTSTKPLSFTLLTAFTLLSAAPSVLAHSDIQASTDGFALQAFTLGFLHLLTSSGHLVTLVLCATLIHLIRIPRTVGICTLVLTSAGINAYEYTGSHSYLFALSSLLSAGLIVSVTVKLTERIAFQTRSRFLGSIKKYNSSGNNRGDY